MIYGTKQEESCSSTATKAKASRIEEKACDGRSETKMGNHFKYVYNSGEITTWVLLSFGHHSYLL